MVINNTWICYCSLLLLGENTVYIGVEKKNTHETKQEAQHNKDKTEIWIICVCRGLREPHAALLFTSLKAFVFFPSHRGAGQPLHKRWQRRKKSLDCCAFNAKRTWASFQMIWSTLNTICGFTIFFKYFHCHRYCLIPLLLTCIVSMRVMFFSFLFTKSRLLPFIFEFAFFSFKLSVKKERRNKLSKI